MFVVVMGCGRVGARVAAHLSRSGHEVTVLDINGEAFEKLERYLEQKQAHSASNSDTLHT